MSEFYIKLNELNNKIRKKNYMTKFIILSKKDMIQMIQLNMFIVFGIVLMPSQNDFKIMKSILLEKSVKMKN